MSLKSKLPTLSGPAFAGMLSSLVLALLLPLGAPAQDATDELRRKLLELEQRLQRLEERRSEEPPAAAGTQAHTVDLQELRRQLDVLAAELEKLRSGEPDLEVSERKAKSLGVGSAAAGIYRKRQGVSLAGYGEMLYENFAAKNEAGAGVRRGSQIDFLRAILYAGYRFNDKFVFNSEIELEHASSSKAGEISLEFAYVDYMASDHLTLRGGLLLVPMGLTNEFHEPNAFLGARRSETETHILPSTWRENGFGVLGSAGPFQYRAYLVNGLNAAGFSSNGLRGGRQKGSVSRASDFAFVGRLDYAPTPGIFLGGSIYSGGSGQGQYFLQDREIEVATTIGELHAQAQFRGLDLRALYARASLGDVADLNRSRGLTGSSSIGSVLQGGYVQFGYNVLSRVNETIAVTPFYRYERVQTQSRVPAGFAMDPSRDRSLHTMGLDFRPIHPIVIKGDYQWVRNRARTGLNQFNIGLGYAF